MLIAAGLLAAAAAALLGAPNYLRKAYYVRQAMAQTQPGQAYVYALRAAQLGPVQADLWELAGDYAWQAAQTGASDGVDETERTAVTAAPTATPVGPGLAETADPPPPAQPPGDDTDYAQAAVAAYQRAAEIGGLSCPARGQWGYAYHRLGQDDAAVRAWEQAGADCPQQAAWLRSAVEWFLQQGHLGKAEGVLLRLTARAPDDGDAWAQLGLVQLAFDPPASLIALDQAANLDARYRPLAQAARRATLAGRSVDDPAYNLLLAGRVLAERGEWGLAYQAFGRAAVLRPDYAEAWAYLGEALQHPAQGSLLPLPPSHPSDGAPGRKELEKALALQPDSQAALSLMALYWMRQGQPDQATPLIERAIARDPQNLALAVQLADAHALAGRLEQANEAYRALVQRAPGESLYRRLWIEFMLQNAYQVQDTALPAARQLVIDFPDQGAALDVLGQALLKVNDLENARRVLQRAVLADRGYAPAYVHLGQAQWLLGEATAARANLSQALALDPQGILAPLAQRILEAMRP